MNGAFGQLLRKHREYHGYSMGKLARLSRTTIPTISLVEAGSRTPPKASVARWAKALELVGDDKVEFIALANRAKWKKADAYERVCALEDKLNASLALVELIFATCAEQGIKIPEEMVKRLEALREPS